MQRERLAREHMIAEQNAAYQQSLQADREKLKKKEEQKRIEEEERQEKEVRGTPTKSCIILCVLVSCWLSTFYVTVHG